MAKTIKETKYILKRSKNGKKREGKATTALYIYEKDSLKVAARKMAEKLGHKNMSISAYINIKLMLPH